MLISKVRIVKLQVPLAHCFLCNFIQSKQNAIMILEGGAKGRGGGGEGGGGGSTERISHILGSVYLVI